MRLLLALGDLMHYELPLIKELCAEIGLKASTRDENEVVIELDRDIVLCIKNLDDDDCLIGFEGTPWHFHDDIQFTDGRGYYTEVSYLDLVTEISLGKVLVCELWESENLKDRYLIHSGYNDEFKYMQPNEKIIVKSFAVKGPAA